MSQEKKRSGYLAMYQVLLLGAFPVGTPPPSLPTSISNSCESMGRQHAERYDSNQLFESCSDEYKSSALSVNVRLSSDGSYLVYGAGDLFFSQMSTSGSALLVSRVVAGKQSPLSNIKHLYLDEVSQELLILDGASESTLYVFQTTQNGNVLPIRQFSSSDMAGAIATATNPKAGELYVLNRTSNTINVYNRLADSRSHLPERAITLKRSINLANYGILDNQAVDLAFDPGRAELYILNSSSGQVAVIDPRIVPQGAAAPLRILDATAGGTITPTALFFNSARQNLRITGSDRSLTSVNAWPSAQ